MKKITLLVIAILAAAAFVNIRKATEAVTPEHAPQHNEPNPVGERPSPVVSRAVDGRNSTPSPILETSFRWHAFFASTSPTDLRLNPNEARVLEKICADTLMRVMLEIARHGQIEQPSGNERSFTFALPDAVGDTLRVHFLDEVERALGSTVRNKVSDSPQICAELEASLFHFGTTPMVVTFVADTNRFEDATAFSWTRAVAADRNKQRAPLVLQGRISRDGFERVYGAVAARLLSGG